MCTHKLSQERERVVKIQHKELFLPKIASPVFIQSMKQNLLSVLRTVKYAVIFVTDFSRCF